MLCKCRLIIFDLLLPLILAVSTRASRVIYPNIPEPLIVEQIPNSNTKDKYAGFMNSDELQIYIYLRLVTGGQENPRFYTGHSIS